VLSLRNNGYDDNQNNNDTFVAGKLEKTDNKPGMGSETSKLTTLSKAIDAIQDNSKSLETMGKIRFRFKIIIQVLNRNTKFFFLNS